MQLTQIQLEDGKENFSGCPPRVCAAPPRVCVSAGGLTPPQRGLIASASFSFCFIVSSGVCVLCCKVATCMLKPS